MTRTSCSRRGLTLPEVLVALVLGALVWQMCSRLLDVLSRADSSLRNAARIDDHLWSSWIDVREAASQVPLASTDSDAFIGTADRAQVTTRCLNALGVTERCRREFYSFRDGGRCRLALRDSQDGEVRAGPIGSDCQMRYLLESAGGGLWQSEWRTEGTIPLALAAVSSRDTTFVRIGPAR